MVLLLSLSTVFVPGRERRDLLSVDPTNWRAEHAIRPAAVTRKIGGGMLPMHPRPPDDESPPTAPSDHLDLPEHLTLRVDRRRFVDICSAFAEAA